MKKEEDEKYLSIDPWISEEEAEGKPMRKRRRNEIKAEPQVSVCCSS